MGVQELRHEARLMEWRELAAECRSSGETVTAWCRERGISSKTYYRWEKAVLTRAERQLAASEGAPGPVFVPAPVYREGSGPLPSGPEIAARVHTAAGEVDIFNGADEETVGMLLRALKYAE